MNTTIRDTIVVFKQQMKEIMEISKRTIEILKNFASINQSIYYNPDDHANSLTTKSVDGNMMARAEIEETFPAQFAIYNISDFLSALSMFDNPDLIFDTKFLTIRESGAKRGGLKFYFCEPSLIVYPKNKLKMPEVTHEFMITNEQLNRIEKSAKVLGLNDLVIFGDDDGVHAIVTDKKNVTSNDFEMTLVDKSSGTFEYSFTQSYWKFLQNDYRVIIHTKDTPKGKMGLAYFESEDGTVSYGVSMTKI